MNFLPGMKVFGVERLAASRQRRRHNQAVVKRETSLTPHGEGALVKRLAWENFTQRPERRVQKIFQFAGGELPRKFFDGRVEKFLDHLEADDSPAIFQRQFMQFPAAGFFARILVEEGVDQDVRIEKKFSAHSSRRGKFFRRVRGHDPAASSVPGSVRHDSAARHIP